MDTAAAHYDLDDLRVFTAPWLCPEIEHSKVLQTMSGILRAATADAHRAAESSFALDNRLTDRSSYGALLTTLRGFYEPIESALGAVTGWERLTPPIDVAARRRVQLLDADRMCLGLEVPIAVGRSVPILPRLTTLARGLGCLYVMEGSALGGRIIARRARAVLGVGLPVTFFTSAGRLDPLREWRAFQAALDTWRLSADEFAEREVVVAAHETFGALKAWLDGVPRS
jgi:heme oxygenase